MNLKFWYYRKILVISLLLVFFYPYEIKGSDQSKSIAASDLLTVFDTYAKKQNISELLAKEGKTIKANRLKEEASKWLKSSLVGKKFYLVSSDMTISKPLKIPKFDSWNSDNWEFILKSDVCQIDLGRAKYYKQPKKKGVKGGILEKFINDKNLILEKIQDFDISTNFNSNFNYEITFQFQFLVQELEEDYYYSESYGYHYWGPLIIVGQLLQWKSLKVSFDQKKKESGDYNEKDVFSIENIMSGRGEIELKKRLKKRFEEKQIKQLVLKEKRRKIEMQLYKEEMSIINFQWIDVVFPFFPLGNLSQGDGLTIAGSLLLAPLDFLIGTYVAQLIEPGRNPVYSGYIVVGFVYGTMSFFYWFNLWFESDQLSEKYPHYSYLRNIKFDIYHDGVVLEYSYKF